MKEQRLQEILKKKKKSPSASQWKRSAAKEAKTVLMPEKLALANKILKGLDIPDNNKTH